MGVGARQRGRLGLLGPLQQRKVGVGKEHNVSQTGSQREPHMGTGGPADSEYGRQKLKVAQKAVAEVEELLAGI
jgi:hypothetical protein